MYNLKKVSLLEFAHHSEVLFSYVLVFLEKPDAEIVVYCSEWVYSQCYLLHQNKHIVWNVKSKNQTTEQFLDDQLNKIDQSQLIIATSHEDSSNKVLDLSKFKSRKILVAHKLNTFFRPYSSLKSSDRWYGRTILKLKLLKFYFKRNAVVSLLKEVDAIAVDNKRLANRYASLNLLKPCIVFPFGVKYFESKKPQNKYLKIVVPGSVSQRSRDYNSLFQALPLIKYSGKIEIELLGKLDDKSIISTLESLNFPKINIVYHTSFVDQRLFDTKMLSADFLVLPIQKNMSYGPIKEDSGYSCISGNTNDIIRYGIAAITPDYYPLDSALQEITEQYSGTEGLAAKIDEWALTKKYSLLKNKMNSSLVKHEAPYLLNSLIGQLSNINF